MVSQKSLVSVQVPAYLFTTVCHSAGLQCAAHQLLDVEAQARYSA